MFDDHLLVLLRFGDILTDDGVRTQPERKSYHKAQQHLSYYLVDARQSFLVFLEDLDIVVHKAQKAQPDGRDNHQQKVDVEHTSQQQHGYKDADNDNDSAHGGSACLRLSKGVDALVAGGLNSVLTLHPLDEVFTKPR